MSGAETPTEHLSTQPVVVGGPFAAIGEPRLALVRADDGGWAGPAVTVDGVEAVLLTPTHCYLGGHFTRINGQPRAGLARLDRQGRLDPVWAPAVDGTVQALVTDGTSLYLGGRFQTVGLQPRRNLAQVALADGQPGEWSAEADGPVLSLVLDGRRLVVGGEFQRLGEVEAVRLGAVDTATGKAEAAFVAPADGAVRALAIQRDKLVAGGFFSRIGAQDCHGLALLDLATGAVDPTWTPEVNGAVLALSADGPRLLVGGIFDAVDGQVRANAVLYSGTSLETTPLNADGEVHGVAFGPAGSAYLTGRFTSLNGTDTGPVARVSLADGAVDRRFQLAGNGPLAGGLAVDDRLVLSARSLVGGIARAGAAAFTADGRLGDWQPRLEGGNPQACAGVIIGPHLYLGGDFNVVQGLPRVNLARFHLANGAVDQAWSCPVNGLVRALAAVDGHLILGGDFTEVGGTGVAYLAYLDPATGAVRPPVAAPDGPVEALLPQGSGLVVAGSFRRLGDRTAVGCGRLDAHGAVDPGFSADLARDEDPGTARALAALGGRTIAIGGTFTSVGGWPRPYLALLDAATGAPLAPPAVPDGPVAVLLEHQGRLLIGGDFTRLDQTPRSRLACLDATGRVTDWHADADLAVRALAVQGPSLWVGGDFTRLAGDAAQGLGRVGLAAGEAQPVTGTDGRVAFLLGLR